ncbi:hypothetical protein AY601_1783 [Pedobacter cryoconitis]|uniref:Trypsin-like peptidase n=1 Tax=Pedobacter cryoconitis TaxID=188932 RepID=A0A127VBM3_9SPHI|nr:AVAST type 2 anti-phage system protein Avs2 [Pedobacter cryoconitis]AMP98695.1 hypothetical protein AY601_1783 [Pedobacter cryoconitis]
MTKEQDKLLTNHTVRLKDTDHGYYVGSGIIYTAKSLQDKLYVLTAAHCLYQDKDHFTESRRDITIELYSQAENQYKSVVHTINYELVSADADLDLAILVLDKADVFSITGILAEIQPIYERNSAENFLIKGFPSATLGQELVAISPIWIQDMPVVRKFQLHLQQDFSTPESARSRVDGFSGSGVFLVNHGRIYLLGIFSRFLEAGKVIYCQYLNVMNAMLEHAFLPVIQFTFLGEHGLSSEYFQVHVDKAIRNLGPRFSEEMNFRLPIAMRFSDLAKDLDFRRRLSAVIDSYLTASHYHTAAHQQFIVIDQEYQEIDQEIRSWFASIDWTPTGKIETEHVEVLVEGFDKKAQETIIDFYKLRSEVKAAEKGSQAKYDYNEPFQSEISGLRQMQKTNRELLNGLYELDLMLSINAVLLIKGEAGSGKSHLLGDVAKSRIQLRLPTILLLGQLFKPNQNVWTNILGQLELSCSKNELLTTLNHIGEQLGSRVLFMIDALNEGAGKDLWFDELAGFVHDFKDYPFIGLALTVRSTYWNVVIPASVKDNTQIRILKHEGFKGNEYAALKLFCQHYKIHQPNFPILAPEYSNPLFLQLICRSIQSTADKTFPQGFQGLTKIFQYYTKSLSETFTRKRSAYGMRPNLIREALELYALRSFEKENYRHLTLEEAYSLVNEHFPLFPQLLEDLIEESVLIRSMIKRYGDEQEYEVVYFAFERFGDYHVARQLLSGYGSAEEVMVAGRKENTLGKLTEDGIWSYQGLLEALAVLMPETFGLELTEVFGWVFDEKESRRDNIYNWFNQWVVDSLKWRDISSINAEKIVSWVNDSGHFDMDLGNWFHFVMEVTAVKGHPFNSDRFHLVMSRNNMATRDGYWQDHMQGYYGTNDQNVAFPLTRLIEWAWQDGISEETDHETARLVGQTLCWVLASTHHGLRDQATKALVNLLQDHPQAMLATMKAFQDIDDMYILERIYAVAYGCALRSEDADTLSALAAYTYQIIFSGGNPPEHLLLRDYARNIVEYAIYKKVPLEVDIRLIRPPYRSKLPDRLPTKEDIKQYELDREGENYKQGYGRANNKIHFSVMSWDFSRYTIDSALENLVPVRFTFKTELEAFKKSLPRGGKSTLTNMKKFYDIVHTTEDHKKNFFTSLGPEKAKELWDDFDHWHKEFRDKLYGLMNEQQVTFLESTVLPHWDMELKIKGRTTNHLKKTPYKCWIVQRVFELGYDSEIHGNYDIIHDDYTDHRTNTRVDRIGKKYQWIAFFELLAMLTDNYKFRESWANDDEGNYYQGPWEFMLRNIDPSFILRDKREKYPDKDFGLKEHKAIWWAMEKYVYWNRLPADWARSTADLPDMAKCIQKTDPVGTDWLHLNLSYTWKQPKQVGQDNYRSERREIWYMFQAYLVRKKDRQKVVSALKDENFHGRRFPEDHATTDMLAREQYWSPISKQNAKGSKEWIEFKEAGCKVVLTNKYAVGELSQDQSSAHFYFQMPCKMIMEGMNLRFGRMDGDFVNSDGEVIMTNKSVNGVMIRKVDFLNYLERNKLEIFWVFLGEKNSFAKGDHLKDYRKSLSGVYCFEGQNLSGSMKMRNW